MSQTQPRTFRTTRWSLVLAAAGTTGPTSKAALADLCRLYWYPLYVYVRRKGESPADAEELTQGIFADLLERKDLGKADPARGKFRSWMMGRTNHYLANRHDFKTAQKRGGGNPLLSLDEQDAEGRYAHEATDGVTAEQLYLRRWAMAVVQRVLTELRDEKVAMGKVARFDVLKPYLVDEGEESYARIGALLSLNEGAVKTAVCTLRDSFRDRLRAEIAGTVDSVDDIDAEIRELLAALTFRR